MQRVDVGELGLAEHREAGREADERAEGGHVQPAHQPVVLALEDHRLVAERGLGVGDVVHPEPGRDRYHGDERHPDPAGVLQPQATAVAELLRLAAEGAEQAAGHRQRHGELHHRDAEVAEPGIQAEGGALLALRIEEADIGHARGEVAAAEAAEQRDQGEHPVRGARVLHGEAQPDARDQHRGGAQGGPATTAEDRHHERIEHPQGGAGDRRQRREQEQLVVAEGEAGAVQAHSHRAPDHPHGEGEQQRGDRDPQVAAGDALAVARPELGVLGAPVEQQRSPCGFQLGIGDHAHDGIPQEWVGRVGGRSTSAEAAWPSMRRCCLIA